ncbi:hypothetical protein XA68_15522 [Ophiocordyceps unilateralis]|uniref:Uncharacterized protein n=1 Tax=Ophiocordyceps unilateralis TaxID=268505 RepID=A0A2A9P6E4_OPHUN|nr:hypothetical protein XA68_15522 [Ophiocordyceps unilateralis]
MFTTGSFRHATPSRRGTPSCPSVRGSRFAADPVDPVILSLKLRRWKTTETDERPRLQRTSHSPLLDDPSDTCMPETRGKNPKT